MGGFMKTINQVVYYSLDTPAARSIAKKISEAKANDILFLDDEEFRAMLDLKKVVIPPLVVVEDDDMEVTDE